ncbi:MAG TPA: nuclear transport factor 2 family protein [Steroidobacteraceae bacterium]|nr:nuclear transport factor 2 family protein [Steroidobacteraceae bacterium]
MTDAPDVDRFADPAVAAAVAASDAEVVAILAEDLRAFGDSLAVDVIVNSPLGTINRRADTLAAFGRGFIRYSSFDRRIEYAGKLGDLVVIMGEEILAPKDMAPNAGKIVHRRFTDIWRNEQGVWRLALRQATATKVE